MEMFTRVNSKTERNMVMDLLYGNLELHTLGTGYTIIVKHNSQIERVYHIIAAGKMVSFMVNDDNNLSLSHLNY